MANLLINGMNTGKDVSVVIAASTGQSVQASDLGILTDYDVQMEDAEIMVRSIINGGQTFLEMLPKFVTARMKFARYNGGLSDLMIAYWDQQGQGVSMTFSHTFLVQNRNGSIDSYQLLYGKPKNANLGNFVADQDVKQSVDFVFTGIKGTAGGSGLFTSLMTQ